MFVAKIESRIVIRVQYHDGCHGTRTEYCFGAPGFAPGF